MKTHRTSRVTLFVVRKAPPLYLLSRLRPWQAVRSGGEDGKREGGGLCTCVVFVAWFNSKLARLDGSGGSPPARTSACWHRDGGKFFALILERLATSYRGAAVADVIGTVDSLLSGLEVRATCLRGKQTVRGGIPGRLGLCQRRRFRSTIQSWKRRE